MHAETITLDPLLKKTVAILGYGNQGRAHALNLRDSGVAVNVGARPGKGWDLAVLDGFKPLDFYIAVKSSDIVVFLLPDHVIPKIYNEVKESLQARVIGFAHGFCYHYHWIEPVPSCSYFLVSPKGPGTVLRDEYLVHRGLPGAWAVGVGATSETKAIALAYAKAIGVANIELIETTFQEETECDLFGEQAVLCGGLLELLNRSFEVLIQNGQSPRMAFYDICYETKLILDLLLRVGPSELYRRISPTAFYGGWRSGKRVIPIDTQKELESIFLEIRSGKFAEEWRGEIQKGLPTLEEAFKKTLSSPLEQAFREWKEHFPERDARKSVTVPKQP